MKLQLKYTWYRFISCSDKATVSTSWHCPIVDTTAIRDEYEVMNLNKNGSIIIGIEETDLIILKSCTAKN